MSEKEQACLFRTWVGQYLALIGRIARAYTASEEDCEDLVQEVLLQVWRSIPRFEGRASASTWIYRVALHTALAWQRKDRRRRERFLPLLEVPAAEEPGESNTGQTDEIVGLLYAAIRRLPKADAALVLLYLDDLSYRDMAEILGITESHVGVKLNRARKQLAELMKGVAHELR
ncbi:MAG: sigma-70 family RNA polymerase sigma factor [Verrucomicrobia bacterium]|nr:sigma-70 family RNA polymerase sigma factor [Verrucomicrobiota bacterium]